MTSALPMILFLTFLFGSILVILVSAYVNIESERFNFNESSDSEHPNTVGHSFLFDASDLPAKDPRPELLMPEYFEQEIQREVSLAARFASNPCLENLFSKSRISDASQRLGDFLHGEMELAASFVSDPSVERLFQNSDRWVSRN